MADRTTVFAQTLEEYCLSLDQLAAACAVDREWVRLRLGEGLLAAGREVGSELRFSAHVLRRARRMAAIERDFDAVPELAALVADLLEEVDRLRRAMRRAGLE